MHVHHKVAASIPVYKGEGWLGLPKGFLRNNATFAHEMEKKHGNFFSLSTGAT